MPLGDLLNKVAESNLLDWRGRRKLVDCICDFISLSPLIGQVTYTAMTFIQVFCFTKNVKHVCMYRNKSQ